jgi:hypothetical protein
MLLKNKISIQEMAKLKEDFSRLGLNMSDERPFDFFCRCESTSGNLLCV